MATATAIQRRAKGRLGKVRPKFVDPVPRGANLVSRFVAMKGEGMSNEQLMFSGDEIDALRAMFGATIEDATAALQMIEGASESAEADGGMPPALLDLINDMVIRLEGDTAGEGTEGDEEPAAMAADRVTACAAIKGVIERLGACMASMAEGGEDMPKTAGAAYADTLATLQGLTAKAAPAVEAPAPEAEAPPVVEAVAEPAAKEAEPIVAEATEQTADDGIAAAKAALAAKAGRTHSKETVMALAAAKSGMEAAIKVLGQMIERQQSRLSAMSAPEDPAVAAKAAAEIAVKAALEKTNAELTAQLAEKVAEIAAKNDELAKLKSARPTPTGGQLGSSTRDGGASGKPLTAAERVAKNRKELGLPL